MSLIRRSQRYSPVLRASIGVESGLTRDRSLANLPLMEVSVELSAENATGKFPIEVRFHAHITVSEPTTVLYQWKRSDGATAAVEKATYSKAGTYTVNTSWQLGVPYQGWMSLAIISPLEVESNQAPFVVTGQEPSKAGDLQLVGNLVQSGGSPLPDGIYPLRIRAYESQAAEKVLWETNAGSVLVRKGMFVVKLGPLQSLPDALSTGTAYIELQVGDTPPSAKTPLKATVLGPNNSLLPVAQASAMFTVDSSAIGAARIV